MIAFFFDTNKKIKNTCFWQQKDNFLNMLNYSAPALR